MLDDIPDEPIVNRGIGVNQHIAKGDDARQVGDARRQHRIDTAQTCERFPHDLELPLYGGAQHLVGEIIVECAAGRKARNPLRRRVRIIKVFGGFVRCHVTERQFAFATQYAAADRGSSALVR